MNKDNTLEVSRKLWDDAAPTFDDEPDHGLRDAIVHQTWTELLKPSLPNPPLTVLDIGCGTGSLSLVLAESGHVVTGIDFSSTMIALAEKKAKTANQPIIFQTMDAAFPEFPSQQFDAILCRHLLWTLPEPADILRRWVGLLKPKGRLLLIEGFWETGAGLKAQAIEDMMPSQMTDISVQHLSDQRNLWGKAVSDERYIITAILAQ
jgi:ubiquinone/menaquinone biosynthesis C-methylase UbiE